MSGAPGDGAGRRPSAPRRAPGPGAGKRNGSGQRGGSSRAKRRRLRFVATAGTMSLLIGVVVARLLFVQGINAGKYLADARSEYVHEISFLGERGAILDRNGDELAMSVPMTTVYADPYQVTNPGKEAFALSAALGVPEAGSRRT